MRKLTYAEVERELSSDRNSGLHHYFPIGLQKEWASAIDDSISIVSRQGKIKRKKVKGSKAGAIRHAHSLFKDHPLEKGTFEGAYGTADDAVHEVVAKSKAAFEAAWPLSAYIRAPWKLVTGEPRGIGIACSYSKISNEEMDLILYYCLMLGIRSPVHSRHHQAMIRGVLRLNNSLSEPEIERHLSKKGVADSHKMNLFMRTRAWKRYWSKISEKTHITVIRALRSEFVFGDGMFDTLSQSENTALLRARMFVPLTPDIALWITVDNTRNCAENFSALFAPPHLVNSFNRLTMSRSHRHLYSRADDASFALDWSCSDDFQLTKEDNINLSAVAELPRYDRSTRYASKLG